MKIKFRGTHTGEEVVDSLAAILHLFEEQYGVTDFSEIKLSISMVNGEGEEVELIDATTSEVFDVLEVHKNLEDIEDEEQPHIDMDVEYIDGGNPDTLH